MSIILNYAYHIYPDTNQEKTLLGWFENCCSTYNFTLKKIKDWINSRKYSLDYCLLEYQYIVPADIPFPGYSKQSSTLIKTKKEYLSLSELVSRMLFATLGQLYDTWDFFLKPRYGFLGFKTFGIKIRNASS